MIENRLFGGEVPAPAKEIQRALNIFEKAKEEAVVENIRKIVVEQLKDVKAIQVLPDGEKEREYGRLIERILTGKGSTTRDPYTRDIETSMDKKILKQAQEEAEKIAGSQITLPEAMDLLLSAQRYRNYMFGKAQNDLQYGMPSAFARSIMSLTLDSSG